MMASSQLAGDLTSSGVQTPQTQKDLGRPGADPRCQGRGSGPTGHGLMAGRALPSIGNMDRGN